MRIVLFSTGLRSHVYTDIALAQRLTQNGHEVMVYANRQDGEAIARRNNTSYRRYDRDLLSDLVARWQTDGQTPDKVVCHVELHREQLHAIAAGLPTMTVETQASPDRLPDVPPLSSNHVPGRLPRLTASIAWRRLYRARRANPAFRRQVDHLRALAQRLGVDFDDLATFEHWHPVRFRSIPQICLSAAEFDFPTQARRHTPLTGPLIQITRNEDIAEELADWIANNSTKPLIYCSLGSLMTNRTAVDRVIEAAVSQPQWRWLIGTLAMSADDEVAPICVGYDHVRLQRDVPQCRVLDYAQVMISGAGIASINECVFKQTPMLVHSLGVLDQNGNAARVEYHRIGRRIDLERADAQTITVAVKQLLTDTTYREHLAQLRRLWRHYNDQNAAIDAIQASA